MSDLQFRLLIVLATLLVSAWPPAPALAADFVVTRQDDPTPDGCVPADCSLREAIIAANATVEADTIQLGSFTYALSIAGQGEDAALTGDLDITSPITILGENSTIVEAGSSSALGIDRVFDVISSSLSISGFTVRHGNPGNGSGGGVRVASGASLTANLATITQNQAGVNGGGIANSGSLTMSNSTVSSNTTSTGGTADQLGGGLATFSTGSMALTNVAISGNVAGRQGGGVWNGGVGSTITGGSIIGNSTPTGTTVATRDGGGVNNSTTGTLTISGVSITSNTSGRDGGGLVNSGTLTINNGTSISGNSTTPPDPSDPNVNDHNGGGIRNFTSGVLTISDSTISNNTAFRSGGGVAAAGQVELTNTTVTANQAGSSGGGLNAFASFANGAANKLKITGGTVSQNSAVSNGGGILASGLVEIANATVSNNQSGSNGGGVAAFATSTAGVTTQLKITGGTISANTSALSGGGVGASGSVILNGVTISGNTAGSTGSGNGGGFGAFISTVSGVTTLAELTGVTIIQNTASGNGGGMSALGADFTMTGSTIENNSATLDGAGIMKGTGSSSGFTHTSQATIASTLVKDNHGTTANSDGGGIANAAGPLEIRDSTIEDNDVLGFGGGLGNFNGGVTTVSNSSIRNNEAAQAGGISQNNQTSTSLTLTDTTVSGNRAVNGSGGGLIVGSNSGSITLVRSTFSGNTAVNSGGLSIGSGSSLTATNSTVSNNSVTQTSGGLGTFGSVSLANVTFNGNQAAQAGAINVLSGSVNLKNTILANSSGGNCLGAVTTQGHNLEFPGNSCGLSAEQSDLINVDPMLGPLANNGGSTLTHALSGNSPAVDAGVNTECPSADQRGTARPNDGNGDGTGQCDIGAVEASVVILTVTKSGSGTGAVGGAGIDCGAACQRTYAIGRTITLTATPSNGSTFAGWSGACSGTGTCQITLDAAKSVTAAFTPGPLTLTVTKAGTGAGTVTSSPAGIDCGADCSESYAAGAVVTLTAAPAQGPDISMFVGWSGACSGIGTCQVTMDGAKSLIATFQRPNVGVTVGPGLDKTLVATLAARTGCGPIDRIQFGDAGLPFNNARVGISSPSGGPTGLTSGFTYTPPAGTTSVSLTIQRVVQSGGATVTPILFYDGCGEWRTFVGGGADAFR